MRLIKVGCGIRKCGNLLKSDFLFLFLYDFFDAFIFITILDSSGQDSVPFFILVFFIQRNMCKTMAYSIVKSVFMLEWFVIDAFFCWFFFTINFERQTSSVIISVDVYRKPNSTNNYIDNKSFHCFQHKYAVYNTISHLSLTHIFLNEEDYNEERNTILATGIENGYKNEGIEKILQKQEKKIRLQQIISFSNTTTNPTFIRRISLTYYPKLTNELIKIFKKHKIQIINNSKKFKIKNHLKSTKNKKSI
jgi:hypothetical protein